MRSRSRTVPVSGWYASGILRPVHPPACCRLAPAMRRISSTVSGSMNAPTTVAVAIAVSRSTVMKMYDPKVIAAETTSWTVAR